MSIRTNVLHLISMQTFISAGEIEPHHKLLEDLNLDSLDVVELAMHAEQEFGIEIPDEDFEKFITVEDAINYITARMAAP